jgi:predicted metalloprotease
VFWEVFTVVDGGKINEVALGIAGDHSVNLLFLIKDGGNWGFETPSILASHWDK